MFTNDSRVIFPFMTHCSTNGSRSAKFSPLFFQFHQRKVLLPFDCIPHNLFRIFFWYFLESTIVYTLFLYVMAATRLNRIAKPDNAAYCPQRSATVAPFK